MMIAPNPRKTHSIRRLGPVDVTALAQRVADIPEALWDAENADKPNRFEALGAARHIVFRFLPTMVDWREPYDRPLWEEWKDVLLPVMAQATAPYGYRAVDYPRVMLARLRAGAVIQPHKDSNAAAKWPHKIHVPLTTNPRCAFFIDGQSFHLPVGEAAEVNNMGVHGVENLGDEDRIHLIFEMFDLDQPAPDWLEPVKTQVAAQQAAGRVGDGMR